MTPQTPKRKRVELWLAEDTYKTGLDPRFYKLDASLKVAGCLLSYPLSHVDLNELSVRVWIGSWFDIF